jgi:YbbR domain-containing protein
MMVRQFLRSVWRNLGTLLLAFVLAFTVWISAVVAADPNLEQDYPRVLEVEVRGQDPSLILLGTLPSQVAVRLSAPDSLWDQLSGDSQSLQAYIDLAGLEPGEYTLPIEIESNLRPLRIVRVLPEEVTIQLEPRAVRDFTVQARVEGQPALGFQAEETSIEPRGVTVSGPQRIVMDIFEVVALLNINNARESISRQVTLQAWDADGNVLSGVTIDPASVTVSQSIRQAGGYRDVAVKVETIGQPASGFRVTDISVNPTIVTLFSTDPSIVLELPGFVGTIPLDLTNLNEDVQTRLPLALPQGVIVVGAEQNVEVSIGIAPIESSLLVTLPVEVRNLAAGYEAELSPQTVSVILSGPLSVLQRLSADDVRLYVVVSGLPAGTHLLEPQAEIIPDDVALLSITPSSIQVIIQRVSQ